MTINQRAVVDDVLVDVVCTGRFYDFLEKRDGRWGIVRRQPIYEKDRMDPVDPAPRLTLDERRLRVFPEGYRHLAYLQSKIGFTVKGDLPGLRGTAVEKLYAEGARWLAGRGRLARRSREALPTASSELQDTVDAVQIGSHPPLGPFSVSAIGFGCMSLSHAYGTPPPPEDGAKVLLKALDLGYTHLDSAALYGLAPMKRWSARY